MKVFVMFSCLLAMSTVFAISEQQKEMCSNADKADSLFQHYLMMCRKQNIENLPVYLRSTAREKQTFFTDITILDLDLSSTTQIHEIMEDIFYGDVDVVHLSNVSTEQAMHLFKILELTYAHFIHAPNEGKGSLVASKYPLSQAAVTRITRENDVQQEMLEFSIHGANTHHAKIYSDNSSTQIINSNEEDDKVTSCIILAGLPCTLTILNQQYSPLKPIYEADLLASETFQILPIRNTDRGGRDDDGGGYKGEVEFKGKFGGKDGASWEAGINFEAYDSHGNYFEADIKHNDKGESSLNARAGHED